MIKTKVRILISMLLSILLLGGVVVPVSANAQQVPEDALSYAYAGQLDLRALEGYLFREDGTALSAAELIGVQQLWEEVLNNGQDPNRENIDVGALEFIHIGLGTIRLPLVGADGLLEFVLPEAEVGTLRELAHAPKATEAHAAAGLVSDEGGLVLTDSKGGGNAEINLISLLGLNKTLIDASVIKAASVDLGALSAVAQKPDSFLLGENQDICLTDSGLSAVDTSMLGGTPGAENDLCSGYQVADAMVEIDAPVVGSLVNTLQKTVAGLIDGLEGTVNGLLATGGLLDSLYDIPLLGLVLKSLAGVSVEVDIPQTDVTQALLTDPLKDESGLVSIDLGTGQISVDLKQLHGGNLNSLDPNTSLLTADQLSEITATVISLLTASRTDNPHGLNARLDKVLRGTNNQDGLYATEISIEVCALLCLTSLNLTTTLGGLLNPDAQATTNRGVYESDPYNYYYREGLLSVLTGDLIKLLLGGVGTILEGVLFGEGDSDGLLGGLLGDVQEAVVAPLLTVLSPVLNQVLHPLANVILNRQTLRETDMSDLFTISAVEVNVLDLNTENTLLSLPLATASVLATQFEITELELGKFVTSEDPDLALPDAEAFSLNYRCTHPLFEQTYEDNAEQLAKLQGSVEVSPGTPHRITGLPADAECTISEVEPDTDSLLRWTLGWTTDPDWDNQLPQPRESITVELAATEPAYAAAVNMYESALIDLDFNVAKIGSGRGLHEGGYSYELVCSTENWSSGKQTITYPGNAVGEGFNFTQNALSLVGANSPEPLEVLPGATCEVSTTSGIAAHPALRPTGENREPYTYFLSPEDGQVQVADALESNSVSINNDGRVSVAATEVGDGWKTHASTFTIPADATSHEVNVVHAYDIDTRDVVVSKEVAGAAPEDESFEFRYSINGAESSSSSIAAGEEFTIPAVPVLGVDLEPTTISIQETLGDREVGPVVSWNIDEATPPTTYDSNYAEISFTAGPVADVNNTTTPEMVLGVTNSYAEIEVGKHIEGLALGGSIDTTVLSYGETEMKIRYEVRNVGPVELDSIQIFDPSLNNELFDLPAGVTVDPTSGLVNGCTLTFDPEGVATCDFTVTLSNPDGPFHYRAEEAEVTAEATKIIDGREIIKATATDKHGALRLSDIIGMLPNTGVTTLVWALLLGLLGALATVVLYVRSRRS